MKTPSSLAKSEATVTMRAGQEVETHPNLTLATGSKTPTMQSIAGGLHL